MILTPFGSDCFRGDKILARGRRTAPAFIRSSTAKTLNGPVGARRRSKTGLIAGISFLFTATGVTAQSLPTREELAPAERPVAPGLAPAGVTGRLQPGPCAFDGSELTLTLEDVAFSGLTAVGEERLRPAWSGLRGREIPISELCRIRDRAAEILLAEGFLARVEISPQEIRNGRVQLQVFEARITAVTVRGGDEGARRKVEDYLRRLDGLAPFDLNVVQRQILLASDVPGVRISANVRPAAEGQGAVELVVDVERDAVDALAALQTFGSREVGPATAVARLDLNSFSPLGERTSLVVSTTTDWNEQWVVQLLEEVRLGGSGLVARGSVAYAESRPGGSVEPLGLESKSLVTAVELAYPIIRTRRQNLWLSGSIELVDQKTDIFDGLFRFTDDRLRVGSVRLEADQRGVLAGHSYAASGAVELRKGLDSLGASQAGGDLLSRSAANPQAFVVRADLRGDMQVVGPFSVSTASLFQWTGDPLLSYEEQAIGNYSIGRGYGPGDASGDRAWASSLELRYGPFFNQAGVTASAFGFVDSAWIENLDPGPSSGDRTLKSVGGGLRFLIDPGFTLDIAYARPLDAPFAGGDRPSDRILLNLVSRFR